jgi:adenine deaminase
MAATVAAKKTIGGHYPSQDLGLPFHGYVAGGAQDDHEGTQLEDAIARVRQGMKAMLRYGSAWHDVADQIPAITEKGLNTRNFILCTDDSHAETLIVDGHMDRVIRHAIDQGVEPLTAIQMATLNTAEHFGLSQDIGQIAPGRYGDVLLVEDLTNFHADLVISKGQIVAKNGKCLVNLPSYQYPAWATQSIHLGKPLTGADFRITAGNLPVTANVIGVIENQAPTQHLRVMMQPWKGEIRVDLDRDIVKVALVERHKGSGNVMVGLVKGFGLTERCAIASTVAHDCHHLIVIGTDDAMMAQAVNLLGDCGGGQVVIQDGKMIGLVELPIAGLMSNEPAAIVAQKASTILAGFQSCGCTLNNPNMQLSLLALVVIPELRISDLGLVDVKKFEHIPVLEEND